MNIDEIKKMDIDSIVVRVLKEQGLDGDRLSASWKWLIEQAEKLEKLEKWNHFCCYRVMYYTGFGRYECGVCGKKITE